MSFAALFKNELAEIEGALRHHLGTAPRAELARLWESLGYSLFSGGKRFRPLLSLLTAKALGQPSHLVLALAAAVEMIHTYSLIHDDLPCMDDDDFRRGVPTNHKVFGEAGALLAGDALLTQAFGALATAAPDRVGRALGLVAEAAGAAGMVGGQVLDIESSAPDLERLTEIHRRKTGALIRVSVAAAAVLCGADARALEALRNFGEHLGFAFQLADDLEDHDPAKPEKISFVNLLGLEATRAKLGEVSRLALNELDAFGAAGEGLRRMIHLNQTRV